MALGLSGTPREVVAVTFDLTQTPGRLDTRFKADEVEDAVSGLKWWYNSVCHSRIPEVIKVAKSIKAHWNGIVSCLETRLTHAGAEARNAIGQTAKRKARGFRSFLYFQTIMYLVGSKLKFDLPNPIPAAPHERPSAFDAGGRELGLKARPPARFILLLKPTKPTEAKNN
jgi:transposase